jgi:hypothetical protein
MAKEPTENIQTHRTKQHIVDWPVGHWRNKDGNQKL